jgi:ABC-2 type transport system permease protein
MASKRSVVNRFLLGLIMLPAPVYRRMGVNTSHLYQVLDMKLLLDDRRPNSLIRKNSNAEESSNKPLLAWLLMAFMGFIFIIPIITVNDPITALTAYYGMLMFFLAATLISDFTSVLIDVRDNAIILPRPISDRTFLLSRLLHIIVYITKLIIPMTIAGFITIGIRYGITAVLINLLLLPFVIMFTIFLVNAAYLVILKISTPEKFKSIITGFQVGFAILIYAGYQVLPRMMDRANLEAYTLPEKWWTLLIPPAWFANAFSVLSRLDGSAFQWLAASLALIIPISSLWLIIRVFAPSFNRKLGMIAGSGSESSTPVASAGIKKQHWSASLAQRLTKSKVEEMGFSLTWNLSGRLRDFKLKTYPSLGYMVVLAVIFLMPRKNISLQEALDNMYQSRGIMLSLIYFTGLFMLQALAYSRFTEKESASWIYYAHPIAKPGEMIIGSAKALLIKFYLPFVLIITIVLIVLMGWKVLPDVMLGVANMLCMAFANILLLGKYFPFSRPVADQQKGGNMVNNLMIVFLLGTVVLIHYVLKFAPIWVTGLMFILSAAAAFLLSNKIRQLEWRQMSQG